jgi:hypothetical protein
VQPRRPRRTPRGDELSASVETLEEVAGLDVLPDSYRVRDDKPIPDGYIVIRRSGWQDTTAPPATPRDEMDARRLERSAHWATGALAPDGVTVGVLHTGRSYADDLQSDGIVYHYPRTTVPGRDAQEVNATKAARELGLPLFVVVQPDATSRRVVHLGWVEEWDDAGELFLITFAGSQPASLPSVNQEDELPFDLERESDTSRKGSRLSRPGQSRFNFLVFRRCGTECAVCAVSTKALLDAAHLRAHRDRGTNDPRNGLVLCATHHRALDNHLFGVEPESGVVMVKDGLTLETLGITKKTLEHLPARPHAAALEWCWSKFHPAR